MTDEKNDKDEKPDEKPETGEVNLSGRSVEAIADAIHAKNTTDSKSDSSGSGTGSTSGHTGTSDPPQGTLTLSEEDHKGIAAQLHELQKSEKPEEKKEEKKKEPPERQTKPNPVHFLQKPLFRIGGKRASSQN